MVKDRNKPDAPVASRLSLRHTYVSKSSVDVAGHSNFGGKDDQLVLCASKCALIIFSSASPRLLLTCLSTAGDIHIWDRDSGTLLHHVHTQSLGIGDLTCVAWNPAADPFMFATGSHDGAVHIWTAVSTPALPRDVRARSGSVTPLSETSSQLHLEFEPRTESSVGQRQFGQLLRVEIPYVSEPTSEDNAGPSSRRRIAFSTPQELSISCRPPTPL